MTRDDITRMAREAGCVDPMVFFGAYERFANLVAKVYEDTLALQQRSYEREIEIEVEAEREACAAVCDARYMGDNNREDMEARRCAEAIRARSKS